MTRSHLLDACNNKVDDTGNFKIWPSEEYLANYLIQNSKMFEHKSICELGAGKSGLAAIALAIKLKSKIGEIMISDGNEKGGEEIKRNLKLNSDAIGDGVDRITVKHIVWDSKFISDKKYDYVGMADGLFFREYHSALQITLSELLQDSDEEGRVLIVGPNRSNTVNEFIDTLSGGQMFDHSVEPMKEVLQNQGEEEKDNHGMKNNANVENVNDIKLNSNDPFLMPESEDQEAGTNALDLDFEDELNFGDDAE